MWTGDERVFFYNPSQNVSVWDCPGEIEDRADVKKLMQTPPRLMQEADAAAAAAASVVVVAGNLSSASFFPVMLGQQHHQFNDDTVKCSHVVTKSSLQPCAVIVLTQVISQTLVRLSRLLIVDSADTEYQSDIGALPNQLSVNVDNGRQ